MDEKTKKTADLIVYGKIYTADSKRSLAQAMAVTDGKIIYVGDRAGAECYAGENTQVIELRIKSRLQQLLHCIQHHTALTGGQASASHTVRQHHHKPAVLVFLHREIVTRHR